MKLYYLVQYEGISRPKKIITKSRIVDVCKRPELNERIYIRGDFGEIQPYRVLQISCCKKLLKKILKAEIQSNPKPTVRLEDEDKNNASVSASSTCINQCQVLQPVDGITQSLNYISFMEDAMSAQDNSPQDLESQFILRMPKIPAEILREGIRNPAVNLKDRLRIRIEQDIRHGTLYLDNFVLPSKLVDLPCIIESHKTIDRKNIYKTADIAQMLICMEDEEPEEEPKPQKKKDNLKVDKKYLFPHGITPPLKNVRKRRFRRTLKKKQYSDQPEIEKEVRRLLRMDYEAHHVSWEVIDEEEKETREGGGKDVLMQGSTQNEDPTPSRSSHRLAVEHIFGEALSDSDPDEEESGMMTGVDLDDESRLSNELDESDHQSDSTSFSQSQDIENSKKSSSSYVTTFSGDMFAAQSSSSAGHSRRSPDKSPRNSTPRIRTGSGSVFSSMSKDELKDQLSTFQQQLTEISARRQIQEAEMSSIDNMALRQRLESLLDKLMHDQLEKERQIQEVQSLLAQ